MVLNKEQITSTVHFSNIEYEYGFRTSIFKKLHESGIKRAIFTTKLSGKLANNFSLGICNTIREILSLCKKNDIQPLFVFRVPVSNHDELVPKIIVSKNKKAILDIIQCCVKMNYEDGYLKNIDHLISSNRSGYLVGENYAHYQYSPRSMRPFSFEYTKATHTFSKEALRWDGFDESSIKKYDFFYYAEHHPCSNCRDIHRKLDFFEKCQKNNYPFILLDYCFDTLAKVNYRPSANLAENKDYGTPAFKQYVFLESVDWLYDEVDMDYDLLYKEVENF